jgi:hypothetical protein
VGDTGNKCGRRISGDLNVGALMGAVSTLLRTLCGHNVSRGVAVGANIGAAEEAQI